MERDRFDSVKRFLAFDDTTSQILAQFAPTAEPHFEAIIEGFYEHLSQHERARKALEGVPEAHLKEKLQGWLDRSLRGPHDDEYLALQEQVGLAHLRIKLPQELMFGAMSEVRRRLVAVARSSGLANPERIVSAVVALCELSLTLIVERYRLDLTERLLAAERRVVAQAVPAYVLGLDDSGTIALWNEELERVTGFTATEMEGQPGRHLVEGDTPADRSDRKLPLKDGGHRLVRWRFAEVSTSYGTIQYAIGADVTEEREMLRRTMRAERLAAAGTLAAGLAHEVRNPLNSASLQLQVLRRRLARRLDAGAAPFVEVVDTVHQELDRLESLVSDFLAFAQPRPLALEPVKVDALLRDVAHLFRPVAEASNVSLDVEGTDALDEPVRLESDRVRQALINLITNAMEALPDGGRVVLRARPIDDGGFVEIEVEDTGPGFPEDAPVFDAFFTTKSSGTGLGLAIVHRIVSEHGGVMSATSRPGRTVFSMRLPADADAQSLRPPVTTNAAAALQAPSE